MKEKEKTQNSFCKTYESKNRKRFCKTQTKKCKTQKGFRKTHEVKNGKHKTIFSKRMKRKQ